MKYSTASFAFAALLLVSLVGKLLANGAPADPDPRLLANKASEMLDARGFATIRVIRPLGLLTYGRKDDCRIMIADYTPYGTFAETFRQLAAPIGPLHFFYRGKTYSEAPKLSPLLNFYLRREMLRIGFKPPRWPLLVVAAAPPCDLDALPWQTLATLPA